MIDDNLQDTNAKKAKSNAKRPNAEAKNSKMKKPKEMAGWDQECGTQHAFNELMYKMKELDEKITVRYKDTSKPPYLPDPEARIDCSFFSKDNNQVLWVNLRALGELKFLILKTLRLDAIGQVFDRFTWMKYAQPKRQLFVGFICDYAYIQFWAYDQADPTGQETYCTHILPLMLSSSIRATTGFEFLYAFIRAASSGLCGYISPPALQGWNCRRIGGGQRPYVYLNQQRNLVMKLYESPAGDETHQHELKILSHLNLHKVKCVPQLSFATVVHEKKFGSIVCAGVGRTLAQQPFKKGKYLKRIAVCVLQALCGAHERHIYHLDVSPDNIILQIGTKKKKIDITSERRKNKVKVTSESKNVDETKTKQGINSRALSKSDKVQNVILNDWGCAMFGNQNGICIKKFVGKSCYSSRKVMEILFYQEPRFYTIWDDFESLFYTLFSFALKDQGGGTRTKRKLLPWDNTGSAEASFAYKCVIFGSKPFLRHSLHKFVHAEAYPLLWLLWVAINKRDTSKINSLVDILATHAYTYTNANNTPLSTKLAKQNLAHCLQQALAQLESKQPASLMVKDKTAPLRINA